MNDLVGEAMEEDDMFWGASHGTWDDDEDDEKVEYYDSGAAGRCRGSLDPGSRPLATLPC
jgi:hypothetical protein